MKILRNFLYLPKTKNFNIFLYFYNEINIPGKFFFVKTEILPNLKKQSKKILYSLENVLACLIKKYKDLCLHKRKISKEFFIFIQSRIFLKYFYIYPKQNYTEAFLHTYPEKVSCMVVSQKPQSLFICETVLFFHFLKYFLLCSTSLLI